MAIESNAPSGLTPVFLVVSAIIRARPRHPRSMSRIRFRDGLFNARLIWTTYDGEQPIQEWLVMRSEADGSIHYALSNAPAQTPLERLAWGKCQRFFIEVTNREAKSEAGWDELRAQKYPAWKHQLALSCLATWFIAQTKLDWRKERPRDPEHK